MKYIFSLLLSLLIFSCNDSKESVDKFDWLVGDWKRMNDSEGQQTYENWRKINSKEYVGSGCTLEGIDTVFKENIVL